MLKDDQLETHLKDLMIDICAVMYSHGYDMVSIGALMRLIGVGEDRAKIHDQEYFSLDQSFQALIKQRNNPPAYSVPDGATLH